MFNLNPADLALPVANRRHQPATGFEANYKKIELRANKRFANKWSLTASFLYTWIDEFGSSYFGERRRGQRPPAPIPSLFSSFASQVGFPLTAADLTRATSSRSGTSSSTAPGSRPGACASRPSSRSSRAIPAGRVFNATAASGAPAARA